VVLDDQKEICTLRELLGQTLLYLQMTIFTFLSSHLTGLEELRPGPSVNISILQQFENSFGVQWINSLLLKFKGDS
jgi:hypothetical protein